MDRSVSRLLWVWGPAVAFMALLFALSSIPQLPSPPGGLSAYWLHGLSYAGLGMLVLRAFAAAEWVGVTPRRAAAAFVVATLYGLSDELHQRFVPGRTADVWDFIADGVGALIGVLLVWSCSIVLSTRRRR